MPPRDLDREVATTDDAAARRRMQNRIAQRIHRRCRSLPSAHITPVFEHEQVLTHTIVPLGERCKHSSTQQRKDNRNTVIWTQPHTIPRPPVRARDQKQQQHQWSPPQSKSKTQSRDGPTTAAQVTPSSLPPPEQQEHPQHKAQAQPQTQPAYKNHDHHHPASGDDTHWVGSVVLGNDQPFDQTSDIVQLRHLLSPAGSSKDMSMPDYFGHISSACDPVASIPAAGNLASGEGAWDWMNTNDNNDGDREDEDGDGDGGSDKLSGYNALHLAAHHGQTSIVRLLLKIRPADADLLTGHGQSALHIAAAGIHVDVVVALLDHGADPVMQDDLGRTPLHIAVTAGARAVARLLVDQRVECLHLRDMTGWTPLHAAVVLGHEDIVRLLLDKGADPATIVI